MNADNQKAINGLALETLEDVADAVQALRAAVLFGGYGDAGTLTAVAEAHFLLALSTLECAQRQFQLAAYHECQARAAFQLGGGT